MIYTITFNPALDYIVTVPECISGAVNRTTAEKIFVGGKGINVSVVLKNLGVENTALGFISGFTGEMIKHMLDGIGCKNDFIRLGSGFSRINVKIKSIQETEINGMGPQIDSDAVKELYKRLDKLKDGDMLVLAGSVPSTVQDSVYRSIIQYICGKKIDVVVDATKDLLVSVLDCKPFLIKPNNHELGEIFGAELKTHEAVIPYARKLRKMGAKNVLVSMAGEGAVLIAENGREYMSGAPKGRVINSTGAGDSMVAGFIAGYREKRDYEYAFKMGLSAGSASAFSEDLATREKVIKVYNMFETIS